MRLGGQETAPPHPLTRVPGMNVEISRLPVHNSAPGGTLACGCIGSPCACPVTASGCLLLPRIPADDALTFSQSLQMPCSCTLPCTYYDHTVISHEHLSSLLLDGASMAAGFTRSGFIFAQMEAAATLDISVTAVIKNVSHPVKKWCCSFSRVPGFCWTKLIDANWLVLAVCTLGAYPSLSDVAALSGYFRQDYDTERFQATYSYTCKCASIFHVTSSHSRPAAPLYDRLCRVSGLLGSRHTPEPCYPWMAPTSYSSREPVGPPGPAPIRFPP